jgi:hypothetical protein
MRSVRAAALVAHLSGTVLALALSFILTRLWRGTVFRLLRALSSLLARSIRLLTNVLRLIAHDPLTKLKPLLPTWYARTRATQISGRAA